MDRLSLLETLVAALDEGSLNRAAQQRRMTQSAVSQQIAQLEAAMGQQLLLRTSKGVKATRAGDLIASHARSLLSGYDHMLADLSALDQSVSGTFRISVSTFLGRTVVGPALIALDQCYPDLSFVMRTEDRFVDVLRENYDLAIRSGKLGDTDGYARKIAELDAVLVATPGYLDQVTRPKHPQDMHRLKLILRNEEHALPVMSLFKDGAEHQAPIRVGFTADDPELILQAVMNGSGYTRVPRILVASQLASGALEVVLPDYPPAPKDIYAVFPSRHADGTRLQTVLDAILSHLAGLTTGDTPTIPTLFPEATGQPAPASTPAPAAE